MIPTPIKVSDYIAQKLLSYGVKRIYGLQGGAAAHLFDSFVRHGLDCMFLHHEQSAALAAVADAKVSGVIGVVLVTTGPAATNAMTGLLAAWQESVPCLFISGQARLDQTSYGLPVRQVGSQECAILDVVKPFTKTATLIDSVDSVCTVLDHCVKEAISGRPGPTWIDIPVNIQWEKIGTQPPSNSLELKKVKKESTLDDLDQIIELIINSKRPLILVGHGIHLANSAVMFQQIIEHLSIPFVSTWNASDLLPSSHPFNLGVIGVFGQRGANLACFSSDLLVCLGANLSVMQTGSSRQPFAPDALKIAITNDLEQLKVSKVKFDKIFNLDIMDFCNKIINLKFKTKFDAWFDSELEMFKVKNLRGSVDLNFPDWHPPMGLSSDVCVNLITKIISNDWDIVIDGGGTALYAGHQSTERKGLPQRVICSSSISSMGTGLAETIGVALARDNSRPVLCIIGDGSFFMNIRDLASIVQFKIKAIVVILNNKGYLAIKHTQLEYLGGRLYGTDSKNSLHIPDFIDFVEGSGATYSKVSSYAQLQVAFEKATLGSGVTVIDAQVAPIQDTLFKQAVLLNGDGTSTALPLSVMAPKEESK